MRSLCMLVAVLVLAPLVLTACAAGPGSATAATRPAATSGDRGLADRLAASVGGDRTFPHLQALQAIADRNGGNRAAGTRGDDESVDYVAATLRRAGFQVETPSVAVENDSHRDNGPAGAAPRNVTRNVVAQTTTGRTDDVVLVGAHLDSVRRGPGIDDDGSGVAAGLAAATALGSAPPVTNAVRFVFFGAEEQGLVGSDQYVQALAPDQRRDIAVMLNSDMIAGPNAGYFVYDGDNSDGRNSDDAAPGSDVVERLLTQRLATLGVQAQGTPFISDSDYQAFLRAGIATGGVFTGDAGIKTPEQAQLWGGRAGVAFDPCYHRPCDTVANIDRVALDRNANALAFGIGTLAVDLGGIPPPDQRAGS